MADNCPEISSTHNILKGSKDDIVVKRPSKETLQLQETFRDQSPRRKSSPSHLRPSQSQDAKDDLSTRLPTTARKIAERERRLKERSLPSNLNLRSASSINLFGFNFELTEPESGNNGPNTDTESSKKRDSAKRKKRPATLEQPLQARGTDPISRKSLGSEYELRKTKRKTNLLEDISESLRAKYKLDKLDRSMPAGSAPKAQSNPALRPQRSMDAIETHFTSLPIIKEPEKQSPRIEFRDEGLAMPKSRQRGRSMGPSVVESDTIKADFPVRIQRTNKPSGMKKSSSSSSSSSNSSQEVESQAQVPVEGLGDLKNIQLRGRATLFESIFKSSNFTLTKKDAKWCGVHLDSIVPHVGELPPPVEQIILGLKNLQTAGSLDVQKAFPMHLDAAKIVQLYPTIGHVSAALKEDDPAVLGSLLVAFLTYLPDSVCTQRLLPSFISSIEIGNEEQKTNCLHSLVHSLPPNNFALFKAIFELSRTIATNEQDIHHLAVVLGPAIFRPKTSEDTLNAILALAKKARRKSSHSSDSDTPLSPRPVSDSTESDEDTDGDFDDIRSPRRRASRTLKPGVAPISEESETDEPKLTPRSANVKRLAVKTLPTDSVANGRCYTFDKSSPRGKGNALLTSSDDWTIASISPVTLYSSAIQLFKLFTADYETYCVSMEICGCRYGIHKSRVVVKAASLDGLVEKLLDECYKDPDFLHIFIETMHLFVAPEKVLEHLTQRFFKIGDFSDGDIKEWQKKRRLRILFVIRLWVQSRSEDLLQQSKFVSSLKDFLAKTKDRFKEEEVILSDIMNCLFLPISSKPQKLLADVSVPEEEQVKSLITQPVDLVAQQITLLDSEMFRSIKPRECFHKAFTDPKLAPNLVKMTNTFNTLGTFVQYEITRPPDAKDRAAAIAFFLQVAQKCVEYNNFNAALAIFSGLTSSSVSRLSKTWEKVNKNKKNVKTMNMLMNLFSMDKNYKNYRERLASVPLPAIPYIGLYTKFLVAIEDNNEDKVNGMMNIEKLRDLYGIVKEITKYQKSVYQFPKHNALLAFLSSLPVHKEDTIYQLSLTNEPRVPKAQ